MASATAVLPGLRRRTRYSPRLAGAGRARFPDIYFTKRIDNSRLCREVDRERRRECFSLLGLGLLAFLFGLLWAWQHFQCVRYGYQIEQLKEQRAALQERGHQLRLEQASLADPQRIDLLARQELGLALPGQGQVIQVRPASPAAPDTTELARNFSAAGGETPRGE